MRLARSTTYSGAVEYCSGNGEWTSVCSMGWSATMSERVCRQIINNTADIMLHPGEHTQRGAKDNSHCIFCMQMSSLDMSRVESC